MRAITVKQPWAWAIAAGGKDVENRSKPDPWRSAVGERIAIHAGKAWDSTALDDPAILHLANAVARAARQYESTATSAHSLPVTYLVPTFHRQGQVLATAALVDVHHADECARSWNGPRCSVWAQPDAWHLVLDDLERVVPLPARGALGLWTLSEPVQLLQTKGGGVNTASDVLGEGRPIKDGVSPSGVPAPPPLPVGGAA